MVEHEQSAPSPQNLERLKRLDHIRGMELLPADIRARLPKLSDGVELGLDAHAQVKFFIADSSWTWYTSESDGNDTLFKLVSGIEAELGYFSLNELRGVQGPLGLAVERDLCFAPRSLRELKTLHEQQRSQTDE
jgi:hypothetical protein